MRGKAGGDLKLSMIGVRHCAPSARGQDGVTKGIALRFGAITRRLRTSRLPL